MVQLKKLVEMAAGLVGKKFVEKRCARDGGWQRAKHSKPLLVNTQHNQQNHQQFQQFQIKPNGHITQKMNK